MKLNLTMNCSLIEKTSCYLTKKQTVSLKTKMTKMNCWTMKIAKTMKTIQMTTSLTKGSTMTKIAMKMTTNLTASYCWMMTVTTMTTTRTL